MSALSNPFHAKLFSQLPTGQNYYNIQKLNDKRIEQVRQRVTAGERTDRIGPNRRLDDRTDTTAAAGCTEVQG